MASIAGQKRLASEGSLHEQMEFTALGGGQEVGRSCHIVRYRGKTIMLDCGVLPGFRGMPSLPEFQYIEPADIDLIFISHFHLDHAAALPYFTQKLSGLMPAA
jgi:cleavage and polyadenylation specificity factor subunit 3